jgi:hypothetical protein
VFDGFKREDGHHVVIVSDCVAGNVAFRSCVDPGERREMRFSIEMSSWPNLRREQTNMAKQSTRGTVVLWVKT